MANAVKEPKAGDSKTTQTSIELKRQVTIKSVMTDEFRSRASQEFQDELKLAEAQLQQLDQQYQSTVKQLEEMSRQGQNVTKQLAQLNNEVQERRNQLENLKMQVTQNIANIERSENGQFVVTGTLENYVTLKIGDNIYEKLRGAEVIVRDGIVEEILG